MKGGEMNAFDQVWEHIRSHQGETFRQKRGGTFKYRVASSMVIPDRTNHSLPRSQFEEALARMPVTGPGELNDLRGPSYLYAILTDPRISSRASHQGHESRRRATH